VAGVPEFRRAVLIGGVLLGLAFMSAGAAAVYAGHVAGTALDKAKENTLRLEERSAQRDQEISRLQAQLSATQEQQRIAVCSFVVGSVQEAERAHRPVSPLTNQFFRSYHCVVPAAPPTG
jgi:3-hydroxyacyl-CoA dehydrogenase